jgi:nitrate/nitrite transporter NarK
MKEALIVGAVFFGYMMLTQFGRRRWTWHKWLPQVVAIPIFVTIYFVRAPHTWQDILAYAVCGVLGLAFGALSSVFTKIYRSETNRRLYTLCGVGFAATWFVAMGLRIGLVWALENIDPFRTGFGRFMAENDIAKDAIAPCFVILPCVMITVRIITLGLRARRFPPHNGRLNASIDALAESQYAPIAPTGR